MLMGQRALCEGKYLLSAARSAARISVFCFASPRGPAALRAHPGPFGCSRGPKRDKFGAVQEPAFCGAEHPRPSFPSPPLFPSWSFLLAPSAFAPRAQQPGGAAGRSDAGGSLCPHITGGEPRGCETREAHRWG